MLQWLTLDIVLGNKKITLDHVDPNSTIGDVKRRIINEQGLQVSETKVSLTRADKGVKLRDGDTLQSYHIMNTDLLKLEIQTPVFATDYDQDVLPILHDDLGRLLQDEHLFVFIGIGSCCDSSQQSQARLRRQQCPSGLFDYCTSHQLRLVILLIDKGFQEAPPNAQIYGTYPGWQEGQQAGEGKVRRFKHAVTQFELWVYGTNIEPNEYNRTKLTIAGRNLTELQGGILQKSGQCVTGNFYEETTPPHTSSLDAEMLEALGFRQLD